MGFDTDRYRNLLVIPDRYHSTELGEFAYKSVIRRIRSRWVIPYFAREELPVDYSSIVGRTKGTLIAASTVENFTSYQLTELTSLFLRA